MVVGNVERALLFSADISSAEKMYEFEKKLEQFVPVLKTYIGEEKGTDIPFFADVLYRRFEHGAIRTYLSPRFATVFIETPLKESEGE